MGGLIRVALRKGSTIVNSSRDVGSKDTITYSEHIDPKKGYAICGMEYEEYVDIKKEKLVGLTYDQILRYLKNIKKEERLNKYKALLKFRNIPFESDLFTWNNDELN